MELDSAAQLSGVWHVVVGVKQVMDTKVGLHLPLPPKPVQGQAGEGGQPSVRDTARSACSGYDDHPTHRSLAEPAQRPSFVRALTGDMGRSMSENRCRLPW